MQQLAEPLSYQDWDLDKARDAVLEYKDRTGGVMIALHRIQELFGFIDDSAMPMLGKVFNLSRAEVHGITSFYHDFKRSKPGKYTVKVCQAEACQAMGSEQLTAGIKDFLGVNHLAETAGCMTTVAKATIHTVVAKASSIRVRVRNFRKVSFLRTGKDLADRSHDPVADFVVLGTAVAKTDWRIW